MSNIKTTAPIYSMCDKTYKLSYFCEELSEYEEKQSGILKKGENYNNNLKKWFKKDILHIEMLIPICHHCYSSKVIKNNKTERILYFYDKSEVKTEIQGYKCKKCGKTFYTNVEEIVSKNSNYTNDFIQKTLELVVFFNGSLRNVACKVKKDTGIGISHQTIENWILQIKNYNTGKIERFSGYYIFDVQWIKIKGHWHYRFTLFDTKYNTIIADKIYSKENSKNIKEFLEKSTWNQEKISITSDLDEKYKPIIEKLGFKHQWCLFHAFKNINKSVKSFIKENKFTEDEEKEIIKQKLELFNLFRCESFNSARNKFNNILSKINNFCKVIQEIMVESIMPYFNTFFAFLKDEKIDCTSNKLENCFLKTIPRHIKNIMKTIDGAMSRIWLKTKLWDERNGIHFQHQSF